MKSVGIIAEYNPFHNGHKYHLDKIKQMYPNHTIILIMSGNFLQRGETSIIDKYTKTKIALQNDIDLIIELPFNFAVQSADTFSKGAIKLLNILNVEYLIFGSETNDIELFKILAKVQLENSDYQNKIKELLKQGINYPTALSKALSTITNKNINMPNDILGLSYVREILKNKYNIIPLCIERTNDYHNLDDTSKIISASNIRNKIKNKIDIKKYIPNTTLKYIDFNKLSFIDNAFEYLKYNIILNQNKLNEYLDVDEGIDNRIIKYIYDSKNIDDLIQKIKTKRYTYNKISRMLCHILTNYKKEDNYSDIEYIRILGMNNNGKNYLNKIKKTINLPIITKFSDFNSQYQKLELKLAYIYSLTINEKYRDDFISNEKKSKIIFKNNND